MLLARTYMKTLDEIMAESERLTADLTKARADLGTANAALTEAQTKHATELANVQSKLTASEAKVGELTTVNATLATENATLKAAEQNLEKRVAAKVAELGIKTDAITGGDKADAGAPLAEQFRSITDNKARAQFWAKHREEILAGK